MRSESEIRDRKKWIESRIKKYSRQSDAFQCFRRILELFDWILEESVTSSNGENYG